MEFCSTPRRTIYKTLALMLICAVGLMGCFGGSSSSGDNGDEEAPSNGDNGDSGDNGNGGDTQPQSSALIYEDSETETVDFQSEPRIGLYMLDPDSPTSDPTQVQPLAQDNYQAGEGLDFPSSVIELPRTDTLPLAVFDADLDGTELTDARYESAVYNTADGELYRISVDEGSGEASRVSSEEDASVVCAAEILSDYTNPDDSVLVYQVAKDDDCEDTSLKAVTVGADTEANPVTLVDTVSSQSSLTTTLGAMATGIYDESALTHVLGYEGSDVVALDLSNDNVVTVESGVSTGFQNLGFSDEQQTAVFNVDDILHTFDPQSNEFESLGQNLGGALSGGNRSITINDILYIVDAGLDEILRVDTSTSPAVETINDDWDADFLDTISATTTHLAWGYRASGGGEDKARSIELANPDSSQVILDEGDYTFHSWSDIAAEDQNADGWLFYSDNDTETIEGVEISGASSTFGPIENAEWIGETWATTASSTEVFGLSQPEYIVYSSDGEMRAREATDPTGETEVTFSNAPDELRFTSLGSYGAPTLMSQRRDQQNSNRPDIWFLDVSDGTSIERITESPEFSDSIPLPWF